MSVTRFLSFLKSLSLSFPQVTALIQKLLALLPPWALQFGIYLLCGGTVFLFHFTLVNILGYTVNPAFDPALGDQLRFERSAINNSIAFFISNFLAYLLNVRFVFKGGRHKRWTEIGLFYLASALGFFPGLLALDFMIRTLSLDTWVANLGFPIVVAIANFLARKFLIFRK